MAQGPVQIMDKPIAHPYVCMSCGIAENRKYYVDTGLDVDQQMFQPLWDGRIYLCNECIEGIITDYQRVKELYLESTNEDGRGNSDDQTESGRTDGESENPLGNVDESSGEQSSSESPVAATLDSTGPFKFVLG